MIGGSCRFSLTFGNSLLVILSVFLFCGFLIFCPISDAIVENRPYAFDRFFRWMWGSFDRFVFNGKSTLLGFSRGLSELVIFHDSPIAPKCWFPQKNEKKQKRNNLKKTLKIKKVSFFDLCLFICLCLWMFFCLSLLLSLCFPAVFILFIFLFFWFVFYFQSFFWIVFYYFFLYFILEFCEELFFTTIYIYCI